jgi:FkbM family methyltransferase
MNIRQIIYNKAKNIVSNADKEAIAHKHNLTDLGGLSMELLHTFQSIAAFRKESSILIDIGAHKGFFTKAANQFLPIEKSYCIEPNIALNKEIIKNNPHVNIEVVNLALSEKSGLSAYYLHEDSAMNSIVETDNELLKEKFPWDNPDKLQKTEVSTMSLDMFVESLNLPKGLPLFIKIDTQGNELNILRHGTAALSLTEICVIEHMFLNPYKSTYTFLELIAFMAENNFDCKGALTISKRPSHEISAVDFLFVKNK